MEGLQISGVQKKKACNTATGFDLFGQDQTASQFDVCLGDDMDLHEDYLEKLKQQRERMQRLEKCYFQKEQQLGKEVQRTNELLAEIERLTTFIPYKQKYQQLKEDFTELVTKYNMQQNQLQIVKQELVQVIDQSNGSVNRLKSELKVWKQTSVVNANQLEQTLNDKQDEMRKLRKQWKDKETMLIDENRTLKNTINKLKQQLQKQATFNDKEKDKISYEIKTRDAAIMDLEKALQQARRSNIQMKNQFSKFSTQINGRQHELSTNCARLKQQLGQNKKTISDKESKIQQIQSELRRVNVALQDLKKQNADLKIEYKKTCELYECGNKKLKYETDSEIGRLQAFIKQLKDSIEELMQVKNHLMIQNRKLVAILKKKQQMQRQRKQLLKTQFKEIDRIQKVIDRLE